jgi:hypothetical protein
MSQVSRTTAKSYFNTGDVPIESEFGNMLDSIPFFNDGAYTALSGTSWDGSAKRKVLTGDLAVTLSTSKRSGKMKILQDGTGGHDLTINGVSIPVLPDPDSVTIVIFDFDDVAAVYDFFVDISFAGNVAGGGGTLSTPSISVSQASPGDPVVIDWADITNATGYQVQRATNSGFTTGLTTLGTPSSSTYTDSESLTDGQTYYYRVKATAPGFTDSAYGTGSIAYEAGAGSTYEDIIFDNTDGANQLQSSAPIVSGDDGEYIFQKDQSELKEIVFGFATSNAPVGYASMAYMLYFDAAATVSVVTGSTLVAPLSNTSADASNWWKFKVIGATGVVEVYKSPDKSTWVKIGEYTTHATTDLYPVYEKGINSYATVIGPMQQLGITSNFSSIAGTWSTLTFQNLNSVVNTSGTYSGNGEMASTNSLPTGVISGYSWNHDDQVKETVFGLITGTTPAVYSSMTYGFYIDSSRSLSVVGGSSGSILDGHKTPMGVGFRMGIFIDASGNVTVKKSPDGLVWRTIATFVNVAAVAQHPDVDLNINPLSTTPSGFQGLNLT